MTDISRFYGPNAGYVLELYERYQQDPQSVDPETRAFFERGAPRTPPAATNGAGVAASPLDVTHTVAAARLIRYIRELGHLDARIDPLGSAPPSDPGLQLATHDVTEG